MHTLILIINFAFNLWKCVLMKGEHFIWSIANKFRIIFLILIHLCFNYYERMKAAFQAHSDAKGNDKYIPQRLPSQLLGEFPMSILLTMKTEIWILLWPRFQIAYQPFSLF